MVLVADLMTTRVKTLRDDASVGRAHAEMTAGLIRHFPVLNHHGELVGVVSNVDIAKALGRDGQGRAVPVSDVMSNHVVSVTKELPAWRAARMLREKKIGSLVVVSPEGEVIGILTVSDVLGVAEKLLRATETVPKKTRTRP